MELGKPLRPHLFDEDREEHRGKQHTSAPVEHVSPREQAGCRRRITGTPLCHLQVLLTDEQVPLQLKR